VTRYIVAGKEEKSKDVCGERYGARKEGEEEMKVWKSGRV
jgi:hypothetical protein